MKILVDNWRQAWRWLSVQASTLFAVIASVWLITPEEERSAILSALGIEPGWLVVIGFVLIVFARLKAQPSLHSEEPQ